MLNVCAWWFIRLAHVLYFQTHPHTDNEESSSTECLIMLTCSHTKTWHVHTQQHNSSSRFPICWLFPLCEQHKNIGRASESFTCFSFEVLSRGDPPPNNKKNLFACLFSSIATTAVWFCVRAAHSKFKVAEPRVRSACARCCWCEPNALSHFIMTHTNVLVTFSRLLHSIFIFLAMLFRFKPNIFTTN